MTSYTELRQQERDQSDQALDRLVVEIEQDEKRRFKPLIKEA